MRSGLLVRDVMCRDVVTVAPDDPLRHAGKLMLQHRLDTLPVVDATGRLIGMVGLKDLLAVPHRVLHPQARDRFISKYIDLAAKGQAIHRLRVADMMVRPVVFVSEDTPVEELIAILLSRGLHPLPVVRGGQLVGIVGRADVLRILLEPALGA